MNHQTTANFNNNMHGSLGRQTSNLFSDAPSFGLRDSFKMDKNVLGNQTDQADESPILKSNTFVSDTTLPRLALQNAGLK